MSAHKTERLLNLVICLLSTRQFLAKEQIRTAVPQYDECPRTRPSTAMFERDKEELRDMGIPLETGGNDAWFDDEVGYRVDRAAYALPEVSFTPDELAVLGLASRVWQQASLAAPASRAVLKLKAAGVEPDLGSLVGIEPRVRTSEPAFEPVYAAVRDRRADPVRLPHAGPAERHRAAPRAVGHRVLARPLVRRRPRPGPGRHPGVPAVPGRRAGPRRGPRRRGQVPEGIDLRAQVATLVPTRAHRRRAARASARAPASGSGGAPTAVAEGAGRHGRARPSPYSDLDMLAEEVAGHGADVQVGGPARAQGRRRTPAARRARCRRRHRGSGMTEAAA